MTPEKLCDLAAQAMKKAYAPYSSFWVGAALLCKDGSVYTGCNIENASFGATNCAERTAIFKAVSEGKRQFSALAVCGGKQGVITEVCPPCGICRQVLAEFCPEDFPVYLPDGKGSITMLSLSQLLPHSFQSENLEGVSR